MVGEILEIKSEKIMDYFLPAAGMARFLFLKDCLLDIFP